MTKNAFVTAAILWLVDAVGSSETSKSRSNVPGAVTEARRSPAEKPSTSSSVYASTLLPRVSVAPAGSQGSRVALKPSMVMRFGGTKDTLVLSASPVGCGVRFAMGPSIGV